MYPNRSTCFPQTRVQSQDKRTGTVGRANAGQGQEAESRAGNKNGKEGHDNEQSAR